MSILIGIVSPKSDGCDCGLNAAEPHGAAVRSADGFACAGGHVLGSRRGRGRGLTGLAAPGRAATATAAVALARAGWRSSDPPIAGGRIAGQNGEPAIIVGWAADGAAAGV